MRGSGANARAHVRCRSLANCTRPSRRASALDAELVQAVLNKGRGPNRVTAAAQARTTSVPKPRPRKAGTVSAPASWATGVRRTLPQTETACPSTTIANRGALAVTSATHSGMSGFNTCALSPVIKTADDAAGASGNRNAGPDQILSTGAVAFRMASTGAGSAPGASSSISTGRETHVSLIPRTVCSERSVRTHQSLPSRVFPRKKRGAGFPLGSLTLSRRPAASSVNSASTCAFRKSRLRRVGRGSSLVLAPNGSRLSRPA